VYKTSSAVTNRKTGGVDGKNAPRFVQTLLNSVFPRVGRVNVSGKKLRPNNGAKPSGLVFYSQVGLG